ncbi:MAG: EI24 domain-containing protein [Desulfovibrionaceae bacterium]|jgi:CysZ protein|nr:EI24 domain-containing protein [Desulfovibrionaceae bacterium]
MFGCIGKFLVGLGAHGTGLSLAFTRKKYLLLALVPFLLTVAVFVLGFWAFAQVDERVVGWLWSPAADSGGFLGALAWTAAVVLKYLLYVALLAVSYFLFMVVANVLAAPLYDRMADMVRADLARDGRIVRARALGEASILGALWEEAKKAVFLIAAPVILLLVPVAGPVLSLLAAMLILGWDFADFAQAKDAPHFRARLRFALRNACALLGFGAPLLVPVLGILLYPFAILGGTVLYLEKLGGGTPREGNTDAANAGGPNAEDAEQRS